MLDINKWKVRWDKENYIPKKIYGFETEKYEGTAKEIAEAFLKENKDVLKISADLSDLRFDKVTESLGASTVLFQQYFDGTPIHGAWVTIHINRDNRIFMVKNDTVPVSKLSGKLVAAKAGPLPESGIDSIIKKKIEEYGTLNTEIQKETMIYPLKGNLRRAWKVKFGTKDPAASWILFIDGIDGHIIEERNVLKEVNGKGLVFMPNPVVTLDRDDLSDEEDKDQEILKKAYKKVVLKDLESGGSLKGPYADTTNTPNAAKSPNLEFLYTREDDHFEEVNVYYHIDSMQRYIQSLGFKDEKAILDHPIRINAHGGPDDNSYYDPSPGKKDLNFGDGNVDDAEDGDIILHEYGHAIQDAIIPGFGQKNEGGAMGEGFGDYIAGTFFDKFKKKPRKLKIGEWDAKGYGNGAECLRRLDSQKHYPQDMIDEVHADGEIWSACLWQVRKLLGKKKADTVILESHFYLGQYSDFREGADAIITAEKNLYGGKKTKGLIKIFKDRGIFS